MMAKEDSGAATVTVGEEVSVKPKDARCTSQWKRGTVTDVNSPNNVSVNGIPRHILDVRRVIRPVESSGEEEEQEDTAPVRPRRQRKRPEWLEDYLTMSDMEDD